MENLTFEKGEVRKLEYSARSVPSNDCIVVTSAHWKLIAHDGEIVNDGVCNVTGTIIDMTISFNSVGAYTLEVTATIPPETIIDRILVTVVE